MNLKPLDFYCERLDASFWAEPINALTNIFIFMGGLIGFLYLIKLEKSKARSHALLASYFAMITGIGSFLFHTAANNLTIWMDIGPISLFEITVINFYLKYHFNWKGMVRAPFLMAFVVLSVGLDLSPARAIFNGSLTYFPSLILIAIFGFSLWKRGEASIAKRTFAGLFAFCCALTARSNDMAVCDAFPLGTHFLWHTINGFVIYFLLMALYESIKFKKAQV